MLEFILKYISKENMWYKNMWSKLANSWLLLNVGDKYMSILCTILFLHVFENVHNRKSLIDYLKRLNILIW